MRSATDDKLACLDAFLLQMASNGPILAFKPVAGTVETLPGFRRFAKTSLKPAGNRESLIAVGW